MTIQIRQYYGFVRTQSFTKAVGLFPGITALRLERTVQRDAEHFQHRDYIYRRRGTSDSYTVDWKGRSDLTDREIEEVHEVIKVGKVGDFKIEKITCSFVSPELVARLNAMVADTCEGKNVMEIASNETLYATFESNWNADLKSLDYLNELNRFEIENYGFKLGCLDLTDFHTGRVEKYGERENIDVHDDPKLVKAILKCLDWEGWPSEKRKVSVDNIEQIVRPCAIRGYELKDKHNWVLETQEEVNEC